MNQRLSLEELAERTGEPVARLREWRSLDLIGSYDSEWLGHDDAERVRREMRVTSWWQRSL